jgi:Flp pilus assembly protein TadB
MTRVASIHQQQPRPGRQEPVLITEAEPSRIDLHAQRKRRYAIMMGIRAASVVLAVSLLHVIPLWAVLTLAVLGTFLPGFAVVMANDRPPKKKLQAAHFQGRPDRQLEDPHRGNRVIDG